MAAACLVDRGVGADAWVSEAERVLSGVRVVSVAGDGSRLVLPDGSLWPAAVGLVELKAQIRQHIETPLRENTPVPGSVVVGGFPPEVFWCVWTHSPATDSGYQPAVYVLETEGVRLLLGLSVLRAGGVDLEVVVGSARYRPVVDPDPYTALELVLGERATCAAPRYVLPSGRDAGFMHGVGRANESLTQFRESQRSRMAAVSGRTESASVWSERKRRLASGEKLRVIVQTTRYATVVRHFAGEVEAALRSLGHECLLVEEPAQHELITTLTLAESVAAFEPDLVFTVNYPRGSVSMPLPETVPIITWVQDDLIQLDEVQAGGAGRWDVVLGHLYPGIREAFGHDAERMLACDVAASPTTFESAQQRPEFACEIALMTRHSATLEALCRRLSSSLASAAGADAVIDRLAIVLPSVAESVGDRAFRELLLDATRSACHESFGREPTEEMVGLLNRRVSEPIVDLLVRQETIRWAARIAARRGWTLRLYGRGWSDHPEFGCFAAGEVAYGADLRDAYASAAVVLHVSGRSMMHQRVAEAALAGTMSVVRRVGSDLAGMETRLKRRLFERGTGVPLEVNPDVLRYEFDEIPELAAEFDRLLATGFRPQRVLDRGLHIWRDRLDRFVAGSGFLDAERYRLFDDLASTTFNDEAGLESVLERAIGDSSWRREHASRMAEIVRHHHSVSGGLSRGIELVRALVAQAC